MPKEKNLDTSDEQSEDNMEIIEQEVEEIQKATRPKTFGILIAIFVAVLVIMIGSLASYYYYTYQSRGSASQQSVRDNWNEVVLVTMELTDAFAQVDDFESLVAGNKGSFSDTLGGVNRELRDIFYNLQGSKSYVFSGNVFVSRLNSFLDGYIAYLRQLQRLLDRGESGLIEDISEVEELEELSNRMNEAYDNLLVADKDDVIQASLSRELFDMSKEIEDLVQIYLDDKQTLVSKEEAQKSVASGIVTKFMQAYMDRDGNAMAVYLTTEAEVEFNPATVLEDLSEINNFKILGIRKTGDAKIEIDAKLEKETPDGNAFSQNRLFILLERDSNWQIDSWGTV